MDRSHAPIGQGRAGGGESIAPTQRPRIGGSLGDLAGSVRRFWRRRRGLITVVGSLATGRGARVGALGRRH